MSNHHEKNFASETMKQANETFNKASDTFNKTFKDIKAPKVDLDAVVKTHKKNVETITNAQKTYFECAKNLNEAHTDYVKSNVEALKTHVQNLSSTKSFGEKMQSLKETTRDFVERSLNHHRAVTGHLLDTHQKVSNTVQGRFKDNVAETEEVVKKTATARG